MAWVDLDWPDLSPDFPEPQPRPAPPRPPVPDDIAEQVRRAEQRRGVFVPLCVLIGTLVLCAGLGVYHIATGYGRPSATLAATPSAALALILVGLLGATLVPALTVLLVIGPTWSQRQQHLALTRWQRARREWLAQERQRYLARLDGASRERFVQALRGRQMSGPEQSGPEQ